MSAEASVGRMQDLRAELPLRLSLCYVCLFLFCLFCLFIIMKFECFPEIKRYSNGQIYRFCAARGLGLGRLTSPDRIYKPSRESRGKIIR